MAVSSLQLALILCPPVLCVFAVTPVAPCQFTPTHFQFDVLWLVAPKMLPSVYETHSTKQNWEAVQSLPAAAVLLHFLFSSNHVIYLSAFT